MNTVVLNVPDISCEHCERTITGALGPVEGVRSVNVDIPTKRVRVEYEDGVVAVETIEEALAGEDYPVESTSGA